MPSRRHCSIESWLLLTHAYLRSGQDALDRVGAPAPTAFSGYHRRAGFFAARGRQIVPGEVRDCSLPDVPALALHLLGEGIPRRYTQNVPRRLFPPEHFLKRPMEYVGRPQDGLRKPGAATLRPDPAVEEQLRGLGYVN